MAKKRPRLYVFGRQPQAVASVDFWGVLSEMEDLVPFFERAGATIEYDGDLVEQAFGFERG